MSVPCKRGTRTDGADFMDLSVVIPVKNEAENVAPLVGEIRGALDGFIGYEILFIDDGSDDATAAEILRLAAETPGLRLLRHAQSCGQSAALRTGVRAARAAWVATLDGDGQNDPGDIPKLWRLGRTGSVTAPVLVSGFRENRQDRWSKRSASLIANAIRRRLLGDRTLDAGCGLKLFPRALFLDLPYFDHMHRFLPALVRLSLLTRSVIEVIDKESCFQLPYSLSKDREFPVYLGDGSHLGGSARGEQDMHGRMTNPDHGALDAYPHIFESACALRCSTNTQGLPSHRLPITPSPNASWHVPGQYSHHRLEGT